MMLDDLVSLRMAANRLRVRRAVLEALVADGRLTWRGCVVRGQKGHPKRNYVVRLYLLAECREALEMATRRAVA